MNVPTRNSKADIKERERIISDVYRKWYAAHPNRQQYNHNLKAYINVRYLSITETVDKAARNYLSTLAVLQLDTILQQAKKYGKPQKPKSNSNQKDFVKMIIMHYQLVGIGTVKMTVGVKKNGDYIQYCLTTIQA